ncbi:MULTISPECIES: flagellar motor switch protein FliN [Jeongeupia]|uniref:Flagellar motor switch protein FliN n=2 Tax=Jeongeupia TaxID=885864 RepID=A0ABS2BGY7_9NEIS|nr:MULTISPECIES: flagellar motor switch protein FliN [Jeongeupia]MBM3114725.1 flagellar motor switch protein FliN [Jeongeupia naejangsanensis]GHD63311.1 hypothetical protein GCM10007350_20470 [Jeongeupia chitinilytica]
MDISDQIDLNTMLDGVIPDDALFDEPAETPAAPAKPRRDLSQMLRKIPVTVTLEVGSTKISLYELLAIEQGSVLELNKLAGEPLVIKVNGTPVGRAEVVVSGENYGLKVVEMEHLDLDTLAP